MYVPTGFCRLLAGLIVCLCLGAGSAAAQGVFPLPEGAPELRFEVSGSVNAILPFEAEGEQFYAIGGAFDRVNDQVRNNLALLDASGALADTGFDAGWLAGTDAAVLALAMHDGQLIVGGQFLQAGSATRPRLAAFNLADGSLSTAFAPSANDVVRALAADGFGHVYAGGSFTEVNGTGRNRAAKLVLTDGSLVAGWAPGYASADVVFALAYDSNGTPADAADDFLYVGGTLNMTGGGPENRGVGRLLVDTGARDTGWNAGVRAQGGASVRAIAIDASFVYIGGFLQGVQALNNRNRIARLNRSDAGLDAWNPNSDGPISAMALTADGHLAVAGEFASIGGQAKQRIAKLRNFVDGGAAGTAFADFTATADRGVNALAVDAAGNVLAGGLFNTINGQAEVGVARLTPDTGAPDPGFAGSAGGPGEVRAFAFDALGGVIVGGLFDAAREGEGTALARLNLARLNPDFSLDTTFVADVFGDVLAVDVAGDRLYVGGRFLAVDDGIGGSAARSRLARYDLDPGTGAASLDAGWTPAADAEVRLLKADADGAYVFGDFTQLSAAPRLRAGRIDDAGLPTAWAPDPDARVEAVAVDGSDIYLGGNFLNAGGQPRQRLARVNDSDGAADAGFAFDADGTVGALALDGGMLYVGGAFSSLGGESIRSLARIDPTVPQIDADWTPWAPTDSGFVRALAADPGSDLLYVGGNFAAAGGLVRPNLARVNLGQIEPSWRPGTNAEVRQLALLGSGGVLAAGDFSSVTGLARGGIAQIGPGGSDLTTIAIASITPDGGQAGDNSVVGQAYTVAWTLANSTDPGTAPTGVVSVTSTGGESCGPVAASAGSCDLIGLSSGPRSLTAVFVGDPQFLDAISTTADHAVDAATVELGLVTAPNPSEVGVGGVLATITLDVLAPGGGVPEGAVQISIDGEAGDGCLIVLPDTSCSLPFFDSAGFGFYAVSAEYVDSNSPANHVAAAPADVLHAVGSETAVVLTVADSVTVFESLSATVEVSGIPDGAEIDVVVAGGDSCTITVDAGGGSCDLDFTTVGTATVTASFAGDAPLLPSSDSAEVDVLQIVTSLDLSALPSTVQVGESVALTVASSGIPDGTALAVTGAPGCTEILVTGNSAGCSTSFATAGDFDVAVSYAGDDFRTPAADGPVTITVNRIASTLSVSLLPAAPRVGEAATVQIASNLPDGSVVEIANAPGCASIVLPATSCATSFASAGPVTLGGSFAETAQYTAASASTGITVVKGDTSLGLVADPTVIVEGESVSFSWSLSVLAPANGVPSGSISVSDGNGLSCSAAITAGGCSIQIDTLGDYLFSASYAGDDDFNGSASGTVGITVNAAVEPPTDADLAVRMQVEGSAYFVADDIELVQFVVDIDNLGPADVLDADFAASLDPAAFEDLSWTCAPAAACSAESGDGDPILQISLGDGESATVRLLAVVRADAVAPAGGQASIAVPDGLDDPDLGNNSASASYQTCRFSVVEGSAPDPLELPPHLCHFRDGFED